MALIKCKECGKEISDQAKICPNCGVKTEFAKYRKKLTLKVLAFVIILIVVIVIYILTVCLKETDAQKQIKETEAFRKETEESYNRMLESR